MKDKEKLAKEALEEQKRKYRDMEDVFASVLKEFCKITGWVFKTYIGDPALKMKSYNAYDPETRSKGTDSYSSGVGVHFDRHSPYMVSAWNNCSSIFQTYPKKDISSKEKNKAVLGELLNEAFDKYLGQ